MEERQESNMAKITRLAREHDKVDLKSMREIVEWSSKVLSSEGDSPLKDEVNKIMGAYEIHGVPVGGSASPMTRKTTKTYGEEIAKMAPKTEKAQMESDLGIEGNTKKVKLTGEDPSDVTDQDKGIRKMVADWIMERL